jgi:peptidoglycan/LPS O-acetylase OafA/YrhL
VTARPSAQLESPSPGLDHVRSLDGMRGLAVVLVFLFHLGVPGFAAGFLGVDVFFVLSGFLITSLLLAEMQATGRVSVTRFWARRVRRLMPALAVLLLVVGAVTARTATFSERTSMRGDMLATTTYVANWHLIQTSSYFANTGDPNPLQHTWSLAIEEQFYLVWPLLLLLAVWLLKRPRAVVGTLAVAGAVTSAVALGWLFSRAGVDRAYMGTDARIFEPLIGALGAVLVAGPRGRRFAGRFGALPTLVGAAGLVACLFLVRPETSPYFLGGAVAVSLCTVMMIAPMWVGRAGGPGRWFSWKPVAWLGLISYGVYLWHWPVLLWLKEPGSHGFDALARGVACVALTIGIATVSFYLIERPIRRGGWARIRPFRRERVQTGVVLAAVPLVMLALTYTSVEATVVPRPPPGQTVVMLTGDSVPLRLWPTLEQVTSRRGWRIVSAAVGACPVSGEIHPLSLDPDHLSTPCGHVPPAQDRMIRSDHPNIVVWWDRWSLSDFLLPSGHTVHSNSPQFWNMRAARLDSTVQRLTRDGAFVVFVATEPPGEGVITRCHPGHCAAWIRFQIDHYSDVTTHWNQMLRAYARTHPSLAAFVSITSIICHTQTSPCNDLIAGHPARPDGTHYEGAGAQRAATALMNLLAPIVARHPAASVRRPQP